MNLTQQEDVIALMKTSQSEQQWNENCDKVKQANTRDGRPDYPAIILSGVMD